MANWASALANQTQTWLDKSWGSLIESRWRWRHLTGQSISSSKHRRQAQGWRPRAAAGTDLPGIEYQGNKVLVNLGAALSQKLMT